MKKKESSKKGMAIVKAFIKVIFLTLFGLLRLFITFSADGISEEIYENRESSIKRFKIVYSIICIVLTGILLGLVLFITESIWTTLLFSAIVLPMGYVVLFNLFSFCYILLSFLFEKIQRTETVAKIISFSIIMVIAVSTVLGTMAYVFHEHIYMQKEDSTFYDDPNFNYAGSDYDRLEPTLGSNYYIGNRKTKKYHLPSCAYLPSEENAIRIKREKIEEYPSYSPCGHCSP